MTKAAFPKPDRPATPPYRPCVGLTLFNADGLVFVGRRNRGAGPEHVDATHSWQMPQGGINPGEAPYAAALRELYEETNVTSVRLLAEAEEWLSYDLPTDVAGNAWKGRYRGQTQKWFAFRFEGDVSEIDILTPGGGKHRPEFEAWRWEHLKALPALVIPFKREVYGRVAEIFQPFACRRSDAVTGAPT